MKTVRLFASSNDSVDKEVCEELERLDFKVVYTRDTKILEGWVQLPIIQTEEGDRYYGPLSIGKFIGKQEVIRNFIAVTH